MTLTAYATLAEFLAQPDILSSEPVDDVYIEDLLERASRDGVDAHTGHWYYAYTQTRTFDAPRGRELVFDVPLLSVTTVTNGNGTVIDAADYNLLPYNGPHYTSLRLKVSPGLVWETSTAGDREGVVTVAGSWGYVDRDATDPESLRVISATKSACLAIALSAYRKRYGQGVEGVATVTGAGVVITPQGMPADARQRLAPYVRHL